MAPPASSKTFSPATESSSSHTLSLQSTSMPAVSNPTNDNIKRNESNSNPSHAAFEAFSKTLSNAPECFLKPTKELHFTAVAATKQFLDPLAASVSKVQMARRTEERKKRKRGDTGAAEERALRLRKVHTEGFSMDQIWEQARKVIQATCDEVERGLAELKTLEEESEAKNEGNQRTINGAGKEGVEKRTQRQKDSVESFVENESESSGSGSEENSEEDYDAEEELQEAWEEDEIDDEDDDDDEASERDEPVKIPKSRHMQRSKNSNGVLPPSLEDAVGEALGQDGETSEEEEYLEDGREDLKWEDGAEESRADADAGTESDTSGQHLIEDKHGLNDGFFSIDDFNRQSAFLERQDARGDSQDQDASDEEIDWGADPLAAKLSNGASKGNESDEDEWEDDENEESDEEGGPTFGNVDLNAPEGESGDETDASMLAEDYGDETGVTNTNNIMYNEFFAPPARKRKSDQLAQSHMNGTNSSLSKKQAIQGPRAVDGQEEDQEVADVQRTISAVHRDLFEDSDSNGSDTSASESRRESKKSKKVDKSKSSHERRLAAIAAEIRKLEAANVAKKPWALSGEVRAADRPLDSLVEEDRLEFERTGKPLPPVTPEANESIEDLIKRRIIAREFDEVIRRRPTDLTTARRGAIEDLPDTRPDKSLAEVYEEDLRRKTDPAYVSAKDEASAAQHKEIETLWKDVSAKLDSLSSFHYRPKAPAPTLEVRVDAPAITMEDAQPSTGANGAAIESMLAPQEIYRPAASSGSRNGKNDKSGGVRIYNRAGELVTRKSGMPVAREELSREDKKRLRRREKERIRKRALPVNSSQQNGGNTDGKAQKGVEKGEVLGSLRRAGVGVIGKKGEVRDVDGNAMKGKGVSADAGGRGAKYKL